MWQPSLWNSTIGGMLIGESAKKYCMKGVGWVKRGEGLGQGVIQEFATEDVNINREFPIIELKVLGACLGPTIFTVRYLVSYLVRYSVNYQILSEIRLNYKKRIIFFCSFKNFFSFFVTVFLGRNPNWKFFFYTLRENISRGDLAKKGFHQI